MLILIQARMSSSRLKGKVLRKLCTKPILQHITDRMIESFGRQSVLILTSDEASDLPIVSFAKENNIRYLCGPLHDVYSRFCIALEKYNPRFFVRVCGDSPLIDTGLIKTAIQIFLEYDADIVTNVFPRSFPKGQSIEVISTNAFASKKFSEMKNFSKEHVTATFYANANKFKIINFHNNENFIGEDHVVDTKEDFLKLEQLMKKVAFNYPKFSVKSVKCFHKVDDA